MQVLQHTGRPRNFLYTRAKKSKRLAGSHLRGAYTSSAPCELWRVCQSRAAPRAHPTYEIHPHMRMRRGPSPPVVSAGRVIDYRHRRAADAPARLPQALTATTTRAVGVAARGAANCHWTLVCEQAAGSVTHASHPRPGAPRRAISAHAEDSPRALLLGTSQISRV